MRSRASLDLGSAARYVLRVAALLCGAVALGCGGSPAHRAPVARTLGRWTAGEHSRGVFDVALAQPGGALIAAARVQLISIEPDGSARGIAPAYRSAAGLESYISVAPERGACFPPGTVYALHPRGGPVIEAISPSGHVRRFAELPHAGFEDGITFDATGLFRHRLLVTATRHRRTAVYAIDCRGRVATITRTVPPVEGGIVVAPLGFGRVGGQLIAPDEHSGNLYAVSPHGRTTLLARSGLPHGGDIGVESLGFVPEHFGAALVADRGTPGNPHPGDNAILALRRTAFTAAGVRAGELIAVAEASALTIAVRCARTCTVQEVAAGPHQAHVEGHVVFASSTGAAGRGQ